MGFQPGNLHFRVAALSHCHSLLYDSVLNQFVPNASFLHPPENIRKPYNFLIFPGGRERMRWKQMD